MLDKNLSYIPFKVNNPLQGQIRSNEKNYSFVIGYEEKCLQDLKKDALQWLNTYERTSFEKLNNSKRQHDFLLGRYTLKKTVNFLNSSFALNEIYTDNGIFGQPILLNVPSIGVSLSHCDGKALAIAFPLACLMSIDMEKIINLTSLKDIDYIMDFKEKKLFSEIPFQKTVLYTLAWTIKESLSKALFGGLSIDFRILSISEVFYSSGIVHCCFSNFPYLKAISCFFKNYAYSIIYPANTSLKFSLLTDC